MTKDTECHTIELVFLMSLAMDFVCDICGISGFW